MANNKKSTTDKSAEMLRICEKLGVSTLYYNTRGECFTQESYAILSENGVRKNVGIFRKGDVKTEKNNAAEKQPPKDTNKGNAPKEADKTKGTEDTSKEVKDEQGND